MDIKNKLIVSVELANVIFRDMEDLPGKLKTLINKGYTVFVDRNLVFNRFTVYNEHGKAFTYIVKEPKNGY